MKLYQEVNVTLKSTFRWTFNMMISNKILYLTFLFCWVVGKMTGQYCTSDARYSEVPFFDSSEISVASNVQFGSAIDHLGNPYVLRMDIYYPNLAIDPSPKRPFVMLFHGGGFTSGDKQSGDIRDLCIHMSRRGFVCANVNYRLGFDFTEYGQYKARYRAIQDGHAALRHIVQNANQIRVDTDWLFVGGQSAGALLALGMVYADTDELDSVSLQYHSKAISTELGDLYTSGNALTNKYTIRGIFNNWGAVTKSEMDLEELLPTIAFHGELDNTVQIDSDNSFLHYTLDGSRAIHNTLTANAVCSELTVDLKGDHGIYRNASSEFRAGRASCFFKSVFCKNCTSFYTTDSIPTLCSISVSTNENTNFSTIGLFPNPVGNTLTLEGIEGPMELLFFNNLGQLAESKYTSHGTVEIDLPPGCYLLTIRHISTNTIFTRRVIKY